MALAPVLRSLPLVLLVVPWLACDRGELEQDAKERVLRTNLEALRETIAMYEGDHGEPPRQLEDLVPRYLRTIPIDPFTGRNDTWVEVRGPGEAGTEAGVVDVRSGASGRARDGTPYSEL